MYRPAPGDRAMTRKKTASTSYADAAAATAEQQRTLQRSVDRHDAQSARRPNSRSKSKPQTSAKPVQAGKRAEPQNPMPAQHLDKPGVEADMQLPPRFEAPDYQGSGKLRDMVA